jgi:hypothetical protein
MRFGGGLDQGALVAVGAQQRGRRGVAGQLLAG